MFRTRTLLASALAGCLLTATASASPTGGQVVSGQATISSNGTTTTVTNTPNTIINWQSFSINPGELTQFLQQNASSSVLNRIVGQNPSQIFGTLSSNGKVYLINPNGILFGAGAQVNVGGLVASSLGISNSDFLAGKLNFSGTTAGGVSNLGAITTPKGGNVYLIAPDVQNSGVIRSPQGEVLLAAGHSVQLVDGSDPNIQIVVSAPADQALNLGQVIADSGKVGLYGALVTQNGSVSANSAIVGANGHIVFKASQTTTLGADSQTTATGAGTGGSISVQGGQVAVTGNALVDASGQSGGGIVQIGGSAHGADPSVLNAGTTRIASGAMIEADAFGQGNGGQITAWSTDATYANGTFSARGGAQGGNGGFIETSGHYLDTTGIRINAGAPKGIGGTWLLDPYDITIGTAADTSADSGTDPITYTGITSGSVLLASTVATALGNGTSVIVDTTGAGSDAGNITVASAISAAVSGTPTLTLNATHSIDIEAAITSTGAPLSVVMKAGSGIIVNAPVTTAAGSIWLQSSTAGQAINVGAVTGASNTLEISAAELNLLSAQTERIGSNTAGALSINAPIAPSGTSSLSLLSGGAITQTTGSTVTVTNLAVQSGGATTLTESGNMVTNLAGTIGGGTDLAFRNGGALNIAALIDGQIGLQSTGTVSLKAAGAISQDSGAPIAATALLAVSSTAAVALTEFTNSVGTVAGSAVGAFSFTNGTDMTVGSVGGVNGVTSTATGDGVRLQTVSGNLTIAAPVNAGTQAAEFDSNIDLLQSTGGSITGGAVRLSSLGGAIGSPTMPLQISATTLQVSAANGATVSNSSSALALQQSNVGGDFLVTTTGTLSTTAPACGDCSNSISAGSITLVSQGAMTIVPTTHNSAAGTLFTNNGDVSLWAGYSAPNGTASAASALTLSGNIFASGAVSLSAGGAITNNATINRTATLHPNQYVAAPPPAPSLAQCTADPSVSGCAAVLPTLAQCITSPSAAGCTAVLPTLAQCTNTPSQTGCTAVLPTLAQCTGNPSQSGCAVVLPTLAQCTSTPSQAGCSAVLPSLTQCTNDPSQSGCSVVLPTLTQCTVSPSASGCSAVLPTLAQCTSSPGQTGCTAVLPSLTKCTFLPAAAGCSAVLPSIATCTSNPSQTGCSVVLPSLASCTITPSLAGCSAVLPSLASCTNAPSQSGCAVVLPTLAQCTSSPTLPGCAVILPTLAQCTSNSSLAGCAVILPPLSQCTSTPSQAGCTAVLPSVAQCTTNSGIAGCDVVLIPVLATSANSPPVAQAINTTVNIINTVTSQSGGSSADSDKSAKDATTASATSKSAAVGNGTAPKMYCD